MELGAVGTPGAVDCPLLAVSLLLLLWVGPAQGRFDRQVCEQQMPTAAPNEPDLPVVPDTFEVHVHCYIADKNRSTEVHEYYDYENNRGVMHQVEFAEPFYLYYDYNHNELLTVFPSRQTCFVDDLSTDLNRFLFGFKRSNGRGHVFSPSGALHFGFHSLISAYQGPGVVRDIPVHTWYSCQYVPEFDASVNVYWSFSDARNWDTAVGYPAVPVRGRVSGVARNQGDPNNGSHPFEHTYDFFHFKNFISNPDVFETPDGVVCPGRINTKPVPALPQAFSYTVEVVNTINRQVSFMQEWYDYSLKVVKFRYVPGPYKRLLFGPRPLTEVHDFGTGVAYVMDEMLGNCTVMPIERDVFDDAMMKDVTHVRIRTAVEFFDLDNTQPVYMGKKTLRGLPCDTWVAKKANFLPGSNLNATWEWAFRTGNWTTGEAGRGAGGTPVQMHLHVAGEQYAFHLFRFSKARPDPLTFDLAPCYTHRRRRNFDFAVSSQFQSAVQGNLPQFKLSVLQSLVALTKLSPLRIANIQVVFLHNVHIRVSLLDKAPISGDVSQARAQPDLDMSANALLQAIHSNSFVISDLGPQGQSPGVSMAVIPSSVVEYVHESDLFTSSSTPIGPATTPTPPRSTPIGPANTQRPTTGKNVGNPGSSSGRYSPGALGGVGVGTLLMGALLGTGSAFIFLRKTSRR